MNKVTIHNEKYLQIMHRPMTAIRHHAADYIKAAVEEMNGEIQTTIHKDPRLYRTVKSIMEREAIV